MKKIIPCLTALLLCGCSGIKKDWDHEITLYLFKLSSLDVNPLTLTFNQEGEEVRELKNLNLTFADCESNRIRIILDSPKPLTIHIACRTAALCDVQNTTIAKPLEETEAWIVLTKGPNLEPKGNCGPPVADNKLSLGSACTDGAECEGGVCLTTGLWVTGSASTKFNGGYCSISCTANDCTGGKCQEFKTGDGAKNYCLKACETNDYCRKPDGYYCSPGKVCVPE